MTPSEIAEKLDFAAGVYGDSGLSQAAATIRDLEAKLKIATEALEYSASLNCQYSKPLTYQENNLGLCVDELQRTATEALARMKEVR